MPFVSNIVHSLPSFAFSAGALTMRAVNSLVVSSLDATAKNAYASASAAGPAGSLSSDPIVMCLDETGAIDEILSKIAPRSGSPFGAMNDNPYWEDASHPSHLMHSALALKFNQQLGDREVRLQRLPRGKGDRNPQTLAATESQAARASEAEPLLSDGEDATTTSCSTAPAMGE